MSIPHDVLLRLTEARGKLDQLYQLRGELAEVSPEILSQYDELVRIAESALNDVETEITNKYSKRSH